VFEVGWQGPNNEGDFITVVKPDAADKAYGASNGYTRRGSPVRIEAPRDVGDYELRYLTGQSYRTLGKLALRVTPGAGVGKLRVASDAAQSGTLGAVEFILDASGSMLQRIGGERRIEVAKSALLDLTDALPPIAPLRCACSATRKRIRAEPISKSGNRKSTRQRLSRRSKRSPR
jgi:hypothetical protein